MRVFEFVRQRLLLGEPPTVREVQEALGFRAVQTARTHLENLVKEGRLVSGEGRARGYRLPGSAGSPAQMIPLLGRVQAGALTTAVEDIEEYIPVSLPAGEDFFALRVVGESMRDAGILPGDVVVVRQQAQAASGDIVVALVEDEATVKRLEIRRGRLVLHPENPDFEPIVPDSDAQVRILGKVVEVRRSM